MKMVVFALVASLLLTAVPVRADDPQFMILDGAKQKTPEYVKFFGIFSETFVEQLTKTDGKNLAPDHWIVLLSPILSTTGETLITIIAIHERDGKKSELPILIAVLNERSDEATVRTAARSAQRLIVETAAQQRETPPPSPTQKFKTKNPRTKTRAGGFHFYAIVRRI